MRINGKEYIPPVKLSEIQGKVNVNQSDTSVILNADFRPTKVNNINLKLDSLDIITDDMSMNLWEYKKLAKIKLLTFETFTSQLYQILQGLNFLLACKVKLIRIFPSSIYYTGGVLKIGSHFNFTPILGYANDLENIFLPPEYHHYGQCTTKILTYRVKLISRWSLGIMIIYLFEFFETFQHFSTEYNKNKTLNNLLRNIHLNSKQILHINMKKINELVDILDNCICENDVNRYFIQVAIEKISDFIKITL
ncbi:hypothetical protein HZS_2945 [Henneguya salminicola]|nr:hypothetical protein HZS_2945 [Henneguya salminicola]